ncbi:MAG: glucose-6-phosphate dehydrogenase, partial [Candidatus Dormibacteria bacterium]
MSTATELNRNPLLEGLRATRVPAPCAIVIFGASGDLTKRKLVPALYALASEGLLPAGISIIGAARRHTSDEEFRTSMRHAVQRYGRVDVSDDIWGGFAEGIRYVTYDAHAPGGCDDLKRALEWSDRTRGTSGNRIYYFSVPPGAVVPLANALHAAELNRERRGCFCRVIIEKPFGRDLHTARELNKRLHEVFREDQIYRIDHYLGKESVQNLLVL